METGLVRLPPSYFLPWRVLIVAVVDFDLDTVKLLMNLFVSVSVDLPSA
jgi:hypothetical protein